MDIIYSTTRVPSAKGRKDTKAINPIYFIEPEKDAKTVYLNGDYPNIAKAYQERGVAVKAISEMPGQTKNAADSDTRKGA